MLKIGTEPCVTLTCDDCNDECWEDGVPHFASVDAARSYATSGGDDGWLFTEDEQVCSRCRAARLCAAEGHPWGGEWFTSSGDPLAVYRSCGRCSALDWTVAPAGGA